MLLYPRLPAPTARILIAEMSDADLGTLRQGSSTRHPACTYSPTGGNRIDEREISELRDTLRTIADDCGYPRNVGPAERVRFDHRMASMLHADMGIVPADAAEPGVWAFLACVAVPDIVCWRFPRRTPERFEGGQRNALRRLWWRAHLLGEELMSLLGEDELVQILERPESALGNPRVARAIAAMHIQVCDELHVDGRMRLLRDAAKRVLRLSALVTLDALDADSLSRVARRLLIESAVALGEAQAVLPPAEALQLLADGPAPDGQPDPAADARLRWAARTAVPDPDVAAPIDRTELDPRDLQAIPQANGALWAIPLGRVRLAVVEAVRHGRDRLENLPETAATLLGIENDALTTAEISALLLLARSAQHRGWIDIDDSGGLRFRAAPSGGAVADGQLMEHSLGQVAASIIGAARDDDPAIDLPDAVVEALGHPPPASPTARELIRELRRLLRGGQAGEQD